jgi:hypothetical protein
MTMSLISTVTVGSGGASSIEFTSIPQDGTDLMFFFSGKGGTTLSKGAVITRLNNFNDSNRRYLFGNGSTVTSATSSSETGAFQNPPDYTSNTFSNNVGYVPNYALTGDKTMSIDFVLGNNATINRLQISAASWTSLGAVTSLQFYSIDSPFFLQNTTVSLYKITKGSDGIVTTS